MNKKSIIIGSVCVIVLIIFAIIVLMPKDNIGNKLEDENVTSVLDVSLLNPKLGYITDPVVVETIRQELGIYSDVEIETLIFKTVDEDNLYATLQYNATTVIGIHYCISTGETVCDIEVSEQSMMPKPIEE